MKKYLRLIFSVLQLICALILHFHPMIKGINSFIIKLLSLYYSLLIILLLMKEVRDSLYEILRTKIIKKSEELLSKMVEDLKYKVQGEIKETSHSIYTNNILSQLLSIYTKNDKFVYTMIENTMNLYRSNDFLKGELAYFFLSNSSNNNLVAFFDRDPDGERKEFRREIEVYSNSLSNELSGLGIGSDLITHQNIGKISMHLLHMSLPQNAINYNQMIHVVRTILTWACENIDKKFVESNRDDVNVFLASIQRIQEKMFSMKIKNDAIQKNIYNIEHSKWFRSLLHSAYKNIILYKKNGEKIDEINKLATDAALVVSYADRLKFFKIIVLYICIAGRYKNYKKTYHRQDGQATLKLLLTAAPLGAIEGDEDTIEQISVLIATIARNL